MKHDLPEAWHHVGSKAHQAWDHVERETREAWKHVEQEQEARGTQKDVGHSALQELQRAFERTDQNILPENIKVLGQEKWKKNDSSHLILGRTLY